MRGPSLQIDAEDQLFPKAVTPVHNPEMKLDRFCVTADLLIPSKGEPFKHGYIVIEDSKIIKVGKAIELEHQFSHLPRNYVRVLMPGLWDCHVHLMGLTKLSGNAMLESQQNMTLTGVRCARDAMLLLEAGFEKWIARAVEEGSVVGPRIYSSNCIISPTGGHADLHTLHQPWFEDACAHGLPCATADGVSECLKAVRMQLRAGANVIKICGSGGVGSERDDPVDQEFSDEEMRVMVEEAKRARRVVGAHCHGKPDVMATLRAGVTTIEHGSYLDEEAAELMIEKGAILVTTRLTVENGLQLGLEFFTPAGWDKLQDVARAQWIAMQTAIKKGVKCAIGTDSTGTIPGSKLIRQGLNGKELYYHVKAGMSPLQAIEAATANGPMTLGPQAPKSGQLKEGFDADFIGLDENPLDDITVLSGPEHVTHVWRMGKCYKSPGHPVTSL